MVRVRPPTLFVSTLVLWCVTALCGQACATTYHVSPHGSNTPPYDTYAKAAHDIADAFLAASGSGDTVFVHPGKYNVDTTISLPAGVVWGGAGRDSAVVNWSDPGFDPGRMIQAGGANVVYGIELNYPPTTLFNPGVTGLHCHTNDSIIIRDCRFRELKIYVSGFGHCGVFGCEFFHGTGDGIRITSPATWIHDNSFSGTSAGHAIVCLGGSEVLVEDNRFDNRTYNGRPVAVYVHYATSSVHVRNNLMVKTAGVYWNQAPGVIENNTFTGGLNPRMTVFLHPFQTLTIRNNVLYDMVPLFTFGRACDDCDTTGLITFVNNAFWPPADSIYRIYPYDLPEMITLLDSANAFLYPMFVDDSLFLLQAGSPLIDAGDPSVLDPDGSRSDIGWMGGPWGHTCVYPQLPPMPPESVWVAGESTQVSLSWTLRPEADLAGYRVYRGTEIDFWLPGLTPVHVIAPHDTTVSDTVTEAVPWVYYVVTAIDTAGLESEPSFEVEHSVSLIPQNRAPLLAPIPSQEVCEGDTLRVLVAAWDPDGNAITLVAWDLPANAFFADHGDGTAELVFVPGSEQAGEYVVEVTASDGELTDTEHLTIVVTDASHPPLPRIPRIVRAYPNPFNSSILIEVYVPDVGATPAPVELHVYDILGHHVGTIFDGTLPPGTRALPWNGTGDNDRSLASGVYFVRLKVWSQIVGKVHKLVLLK